MTGGHHDVAAVDLRDLVKRFAEVEAVSGISLDVAPGEFFSMLGPSGSGKTTVLRMIAGFEPPTSGTVLLRGEDVTRRAPFERDVTTVFQDYALFPHMSVVDNVAYGLRVRGLDRRERRRRAEEALETVQLPNMSKRRPTQLSGGQRQRVALARALVVRPSVLLLDEPLGALDLKLRQQMQLELSQIQRDVGVSFVFVTHDQEEALSMSDRVAVFDSGLVVQVASPRELYERPATEFVAGFVGTANLLRGDAAERLLGSTALHSVRPERIAVRTSVEVGLAATATPAAVGSDRPRPIHSRCTSTRRSGCSVSTASRSGRWTRYRWTGRGGAGVPKNLTATRSSTCAAPSGSRPRRAVVGVAHPAGESAPLGRCTMRRHAVAIAHLRALATPWPRRTPIRAGCAVARTRRPAGR